MNLSINITLNPGWCLESIVRTPIGWQVRATRETPVALSPHYELTNLLGMGPTIEDAVANLQPPFSRKRVPAKMEMAK